MPAQGLCHRAQRAAEVVQGGVGLGKLGGEHADVLDDGRVTGRRALDHVGKHAHHVLVEHKVLRFGEGLGEEAVGLLAHGNSGRSGEKAGILSKWPARPNRHCTTSWQSMLCAGATSVCQGCW